MTVRPATARHPLVRAPVPRRCWYPVALSDHLARSLLPVEVGGTAIALFQTAAGRVAALDDCCVHRPYPLSLGRRLESTVQCGLCGFEYDADGAVVAVPTQDRVPDAASVRSYETCERHGRIWVWLGDQASARTQRPPDLGWLDSADWVSVSGRHLIAANYLLLHESFADVTKIPILAPEISPAALTPMPPPLDVVVSETTVTLRRSYPPSRLPDWQARALGLPFGDPFPHHQEGHFMSPAVWVDHWDVATGADTVRRMRFTHLLAPIDESRTHLSWYVSRDFAPGEDTSGELGPMFGAYYSRLAAALEQTQRLTDAGRGHRQVNISADVAALRVREIVWAMLAEQADRGRARPGN